MLNYNHLCSKLINFLIYFYFYYFIYIINCVQCDEQHYTNTFAVQIKSQYDHDNYVNQLANDYGFINLGKIGDLDGHYLFEHQKIHKRSTEHAYSHHNNLKNDHRVSWTEQQTVKKRKKRSLQSVDLLKDPLFKEQWYLNRGAKSGFDMKVSGAWLKGFTGKGVVVTILDDGIQPNHPDLDINYDPLASYDINGNDTDPTPQDNGDNKHGTRCAGEVAAIAGNEYCGVGIAYNSSIGGVRMLDGTVTDEVEARALSLNPYHIDIYSASWGPEDDGKTLDGPGRLAKQAFINGIKKGRGGKGSIFVWASGNGGRRDDNCNCDGYTNSIYTLSISSATQSGSKPWYLEECSSTLATTYSSGSIGLDENVVTVDVDFSFLEKRRLGLPPNGDQLCTKSHTGTSASAPIAAAICALALEANPTLTWRDMQYIVVMTSRYEPLKLESGWSTNGVGRNFSHKFGYGLMDAEAMVDIAQRWQPLPRQRICETQVKEESWEVPARPDSQLEVYLDTKGCAGTDNAVRYVEHVQTRIYLQYNPLGALKITLTSPSGTVSELLKPRIKDATDGSFNQWPFLSVHFWGENPQGIWKLVIKNELSPAIKPGTLISWGMTFYGINETIPDYKTGSQKLHFLPRDVDEKSRIVNHCLKRGTFFEPSTNTCLKECLSGQYADHIGHLLFHTELKEKQRVSGGICNRCSSQCRECYGPGADNCISCNDGLFYFNDLCVRSCPIGYYIDHSSKECLPCTPNCRTCEKDRKTCTSCATNLKLDQYTKKCLPNCQSTGSNSSLTSCFQCPLECLYCVPVNQKCLVCRKGFKLLQGKCVQESCPQHYYESEEIFINRKSDGEKRSKSLKSIECLECHQSCLNCSGPSHRQCTSCSDHSSLRNGSCISCPKGEYFSTDLNECDACHPSCVNCTGFLANACTACRAPLRLYQNRCIPCCASDASVEEITDHDCCECDSSNSQCISSGSDQGVKLIDIMNSADKILPTEFIFPTLSKTSTTVIFVIFLSSLIILILLFIISRLIFPNSIFFPPKYREYRVISDCDALSSNKISINCDENTIEDDEDKLYEKA
ncbi:proprotein convertase subtilisin/kexin type 4-like [Brevipalpus obovatus]|uniref:proprotein convertase subtilisin/kexin type 4-like n=1 Tax=Brevipalpus obovatus TaxID=246614 RepID=UPI003D9E3B40